MDNGFCHISACSHNSRVRNRKVSLLESFIRLFLEYSFHKSQHYQAIIRRANGIVWNIWSIISIVQVDFVDFLKKLKSLFFRFSLGIEDSISFAIFTLSIIGFFLLTVYTVRISVDIFVFRLNYLVHFQGYGSVALPLSLVRGKRSARLQQASIEDQRQALQQEIRTLKTRVGTWVLISQWVQNLKMFSIHVMFRCRLVKNDD